MLCDNVLYYDCIPFNECKFKYSFAAIIPEFRNSDHLLVLVLYPIYYWNYVYYATEMVVYHYRRNIFVDVMTWNKCVNLTFDTYHFAILPVYSFLFYYYFFQYWIELLNIRSNDKHTNGEHVWNCGLRGTRWWYYADGSNTMKFSCCMTPSKLTYTFRPSLKADHIQL